MKAITVGDKNDWNKFVLENDGSFLQSYEWGKLQEMSLRRVKRIRIAKEEKNFLQALIIKEKDIFFNYLYVPYGPVFSKLASPNEVEIAFETFLKEVQITAKKESAVFLRIEPYAPLPGISNFDITPSQKRIQPLKTMVLNIDASEGDLQKKMLPGTKYNIRLAAKKGVEINVSDEYSDVFYNLIGKTKSRQGFVSHPENHYKKFFDVKSDDFNVKIISALYQNNVIVAGIRIFFGKTVTALHAGSDYRFRALKGPELLHWKTFTLAKKMGYNLYDFWGIDDKKYPGVSNFKRGFGGQEIEYPGGIDIVLDNNLYKSYIIFRKIKNILKRG